MKKRELVEIIRKVVKVEIDRQVKRQVKLQVENLMKEMVQPQSNNLTENTNEWATLGNKVHTSTDSQALGNLRQNFMNMNAGAFPGMPSRPTQPPLVDINNRPVNPDHLQPDLQKALTRDYRDLVRAMDKKK